MTAELQGVPDSSPVRFAGPLYVSTGPYYGAGVFNPALVTGRQAGTMTFVLNSVNAGQLSYSVDGVPVSKSVERQPLTTDQYAGTYKAYVTATLTNCFNAASNGDVTAPYDLKIEQNGGSMTQVATDASKTCTRTGTYTQVGRMGRFTASVSCTNGVTGTYSMFQMTNEPYVFTARYTASSPVTGCNEEGEIAGLIPR